MAPTPPSRRAVVAAALAGLAPLALAPAPAEAAPEGIPAGWEEVDPRTARRVPLTLSLRDGVPLYPGDPPFRWHVAVDTRTPAHRDGGYLLEQIDSLGTHTASHVSAPVHFVLGGARLDQLDERFALMPLAVLDVRARTARSDVGAAGSPASRVEREDLRAWEAAHGRLPRGGCVLLLTGAARLWDRGGGEHSPYATTPVPGLTGEAVDWLFAERGAIATGADSLGPDATSDARLQATTRTLVNGGVTLENVGPGLARMRPRGDWIAVNGNRPPFSGFQTGFTGFTRW